MDESIGFSVVASDENPDDRCFCRSGLQPRSVQLDMLNWIGYLVRQFNR